MPTYSVTEDCGYKIAPCLYRKRDGLCEPGDLICKRLPSGNLDVSRGPWPVEYRRDGTTQTAGWGAQRSDPATVVYVKADGDEGSAILIVPEIDAMI